MLVSTCPHCKSRRMSFSFQGESYMQEEYFGTWNTFWTCSYCDAAIIAILEPSSETANTHSPSQLGNTLTKHFAIMEVHPKTSTATLDHVPNSILDTYIEANSCLDHQGWTSAGIMFRKVLEMTTVELGPKDNKFRSKPLYHRIEELAATNLLPDSMRELAHEIRLGGNVAAHEEEYSKEEAEELREFSELFLTYLFTLPHKISASRRKSRSSGSQVS